MAAAQRRDTPHIFQTLTSLTRSLPRTETANLESLTLEADATTRAAELQLSSLAPRKPNWDLRQRLEKRLKKLERRDKEARLILIRQRVKAAGKTGGKGGAEAEVATLGALAGYGGSEGESDDDDEE